MAKRTNKKKQVSNRRINGSAVVTYSNDVDNTKEHEMSSESKTMSFLDSSPIIKRYLLAYIPSLIITILVTLYLSQITLSIGIQLSGELLANILLDGTQAQVKQELFAYHWVIGVSIVCTMIPFVFSIPMYKGIVSLFNRIYSTTFIVPTFRMPKLSLRNKSSKEYDG